MLNRREFLKNIGGTGLALGLSGPMFLSGANESVRVNQLYFLEAGVPATAASRVCKGVCYLGTGFFGSLTGSNLEQVLRKRGELFISDNQISTPELLRLPEEAAVQYVKDRVVYLAGTMDNPDFLNARELVLKNDPHFLWTIAATKEGETPFKPEKKECLIPFPVRSSLYEDYMLIYKLHIVLTPKVLMDERERSYYGGLTWSNL